MAAREAPAPPPPLEPRGGCWAGLGGAAPGPCGARAARGRAGAVRAALSSGAPLGAAVVAAAAARARRRGAGAGRPTIVPLKQVQPLSPPGPPPPRGRGGRKGGSAPARRFVRGKRRPHPRAPAVAGRGAAPPTSPFFC